MTRFHFSNYNCILNRICFSYRSILQRKIEYRFAFPFAERGFAPGLQRLASSFRLPLSLAALEGSLADKDSRARRIGDHVAPRDSHRARVHSHSFRARYRNLASAKISQTPTEAARGRETRGGRGRGREKWPVRRNTLLVDGITYGRVRYIPIFLRIPFAFPLPRLPTEEGSRRAAVLHLIPLRENGRKTFIKTS